MPRLRHVGIPGTGGEWSLAELVPTSPAPTISIACPESSTSATPNPTSLHLISQQLSNTEFPSAGHTFAQASVLFSQPPLQVWPLLPQSLLPLLRQNFNPVSTKSSPPKAILVSFLVSLPSKSCFPASQMPIRSHPDSAVQNARTTSLLAPTARLLP